MGKINELYLQAMAQTDWNVHVDETGKCLCALCNGNEIFMFCVDWADSRRLGKNNNTDPKMQWIKWTSNIVQSIKH